MSPLKIEIGQPVGYQNTFPNGEKGRIADAKIYPFPKYFVGPGGNFAKIQFGAKTLEVSRNITHLEKEVKTHKEGNPNLIDVKVILDLI